MGKNDTRTAIQQFYTPQTNFWLRPWRTFTLLFNKVHVLETETDEPMAVQCVTIPTKILLLC